MIDINELRAAVKTIGVMAVSTQEVSELLDRLEAAEKERDEFKRACFGHISDNSLLRAKIAEMERQEPVAWRTFDGEGGYDYRSYEDNENYKLGWDARNPNHIGWVEPLYALPCAQPAPSAPDDGFKRAVMEIKDIGYGAIFKHLICERAAELAAAPKPEAKP